MYQEVDEASGKGGENGEGVSVFGDHHHAAPDRGEDPPDGAIVRTETC